MLTQGHIPRSMAGRKQGIQTNCWEGLSVRDEILRAFDALGAREREIVYTLAVRLIAERVTPGCRELAREESSVPRRLEDQQ